MHTLRDFRALRVDTEVVGTIQELRSGGFDPGELVEDEETGLYLYEMARWSRNGHPLRVVGAIGVLALGSQGGRRPAAPAKWVAPQRSGPEPPPSSGKGAAEAGGMPTQVEAAWAIVETDVIDQVNPYRIGPIARINDAEGVAHRLYALVQPAAIDMVRKAVEDVQPALLGAGFADVDVTPGAEILAFVCQAKDLFALVRPVHRIFRGHGVGRAFDALAGSSTTLAEPPAEAHLTLHFRGRSTWVPVGKRTWETVAQMETYFAGNDGVLVERTDATGRLEIAARSAEAVAMTCPALPVEQIVAAARLGLQLEPLAKLLHPRPFTSLILGEAPSLS